MGLFKIEINISENLFENEENKEIIYYRKDGKDYKDDISFNMKKIIITGTRSKQIKIDNLLESVNSTYYSNIIKALLYTYFKKGEFQVESIKIYIDEVEKKVYKKTEIKQEFNHKRPIDIDSKKLFNDKKRSDTAMNALMNLTLSFSKKDLQFDFTWKCFNTLIREVFKESEDFEMLKRLRQDLEENYTDYKSISAYIPNMDVTYMSTCHLNAMICNNFPKGNTKKQKKLEEFFKEFTDYRVAAVLKEKMKCKTEDLNTIGKYEDVESFYSQHISQKTENEIDIIRLVILKYAYYLRCKYFHGEKIPSTFLLVNHNQKELNRISIPVRILCKDLIEHKL
jgi:hypothetical protein